MTIERERTHTSTVSSAQRDWPGGGGAGLLWERAPSLVCFSFRFFVFLFLHPPAPPLFNLYTVQGWIYPVQTVKCNIILYNFIERETNLLVDLCALIMAVPVNELRCKYVFDCAVQLDVKRSVSSRC